MTVRDLGTLAQDRVGLDHVVGWIGERLGTTAVGSGR